MDETEGFLCPDHLPPFKPILFRGISISLALILGTHFLFYQRDNKRYISIRTWAAPFEALVPRQAMLRAAPLALPPKRRPRRRRQIDFSDEGDVEDGGRQVQLRPQFRLRFGILVPVPRSGVAKPRKSNRTLYAFTSSVGVNS